MFVGAETLLLTILESAFILTDTHWRQLYTFSDNEITQYALLLCSQYTPLVMPNVFYQS